jgi:hypothetical protein
LDKEQYSKEKSVKTSHNIVINPDKDYLNMVDDLKSQFPMYNEISFTPQAPGSLALSLRESRNYSGISQDLDDICLWRLFR